MLQLFLITARNSSLKMVPPLFACRREKIQGDLLDRFNSRFSPSAFLIFAGAPGFRSILSQFGQRKSGRLVSQLAKFVQCIGKLSHH